MRIRKLAKTVAYLVWVAVILPFATCLMAYLLTEGRVEREFRARVQETERLGQTLIDALEKYKNDHGIYPPDPDVLVPQYIAEIPTSALDSTLGVNGWWYEAAKDGNSFTLKATRKLYPERFLVHDAVYVYSSKTRAWKKTFPEST